MSSLKDLLNPASSGPSSPVASRLHSPPPTQKYSLPTNNNNTQEAASTLAFFASSHHHRNSFSLPGHDHDADIRSPVTPIAPHHDSSSSDTVSSSPVPPVSPRRVAPMRESTALKSTNGFTQVLRASSSERDADGDEEDEEMGGSDIKPRPSLDYRLSSSAPMVREIPRSSPPAASPSPASTTAQTHRDTTVLAAPTTAVTKKPKKRSSAKTEPPKKKGIAKPQKKKRKVVVEDEDLDDEAPVRPSTKRKKNHASNTGRVQPNAHRPVPLKQQADSPSAAASLPALPLSPLPKYNAEGMELYCVCRKPDSGKWMIGCDGCEDWFHGECINVAEVDGELIDKYFCPRCEVSGHGITTWKRKCRLSTCRKPAQVDKRPPSKYCCDDHGITFFEQQTSPSRTKVPPAEIATVADFAPSAAEFRRLGHRMPTPPMSDENFRDYPEEIERLVAIAAERETLRAHKRAIEDRAHYVDWAQDAARRIHEELKADPEARSVGKEICGYDEKLGLGDVEWAAWRNSPDGEQVFVDGRIAGRDTVCIKKKCEKHSQWKSLFVEEAQLQERLHAERVVQLRLEEKKIKERQKRRSVRDNTEGTVQVEKTYA
ncbi:COMPASS (complex proteins associated with Set1p) component [Maublancomyces gigas]|uniref:COMPASS (Complex proteins associated with Set1p) component n=1 Tax=Discina gigas TaxID=1032678 RepID=A0ABR3GBP0_9PEZI